MKNVLLLFSLCLNSSAATYYVDYASGSDAANGTSSGTPFQHCPGDTAATGNANRTLSAGDTVVFHGGIRYDIASSGTISANASGSAGSLITYLSGHLAAPQWGTDPAIINGTNASSSGSINGAMDLSGFSYLVADGIAFVGSQASGAPYKSCIGGHWNSGGNITIRNCSMSNSTACGIYLSGNFSSSAPSTFVISNCLIQNVSAHGIFFRYGMTNLQILNNTILNCGQESNLSLTGDNIAGFGLDGTGLNMNLVIRSNELANAPNKSPIIFSIYDVGAVVEQNFIHGGFGFSGFDLNGTHTNLTIRNNVWDMQSANFYGPITFNTDQGTRYADGVYIYNNTMRTTVSTPGMVVYFGRGDNTSTTAFWNVAVTNNIVIQSTSGKPIVVVAANQAGTGAIVDAATFGCDYNNYSGTGTATPFSWRGTNYSFGDWKTVTGDDAHSLTNAPSLDGNLMPTLGANVIDAGTTLSGFNVDKNSVTRPQGSAWDIGAYEFNRHANIMTGGSVLRNAVLQ